MSRQFIRTMGDAGIVLGAIAAVVGVVVALAGHLRLTLICAPFVLALVLIGVAADLFQSQPNATAPPRMSARRRRMAKGACVLAVILVAVGVVAAFLPDTPSADAHSTTGPTTPETTPPIMHDPSSTSPHSATTAPSSTRTTVPSASYRSVDPEIYKSVVSGPLTATVSTLKIPPDNGFYLLFDSPGAVKSAITRFKPTRNPTASEADCMKLWQVVSPVGGSPLGTTDLKINLQNTSDHPIAVVNVGATISHARPAANGTIVGCPPAKGGQDPIEIQIDLTQASAAEATVLDSSDRFVPKFAMGYQITLTPGEIQALSVQIWNPIKAASWHFVVRIQDGTNVHDAVINNGGKDFTTPGFRTADVASGFQKVYSSGYLLDFNNQPLSW